MDENYGGRIMNYFTVFMPWLAHELQRRGFKIEKMSENNKKKGVFVYQFNDSIELQEAINEILNNRKK